MYLESISMAKKNTKHDIFNKRKIILNENNNKIIKINKNIFFSIEMKKVYFFLL